MLITELKMKSKLELLLQKVLISIVLFVIIHSDGLIMDLGNLDMAQMQQAQLMGKDLKNRESLEYF